MYKLFQVTGLDDKIFITTYINVFVGKMGYQLRDKEPRTLKDAFWIVVNITNNMRISSKLGAKRDDPRLFGGRNNKKGDHKPLGNKKQEVDKIDHVLSAIKDLKIPMNKNDKGQIANRSQFQGSLNRQNMLST